MNSAVWTRLRFLFFIIMFQKIKYSCFLLLLLLTVCLLNNLRSVVKQHRDTARFQFQYFRVFRKRQSLFRVPSGRKANIQPDSKTRPRQ